MNCSLRSWRYCRPLKFSSPFCSLLGELPFSALVQVPGNEFNQPPTSPPTKRSSKDSFKLTTPKNMSTLFFFSAAWNSTFCCYSYQVLGAATSVAKHTSSLCNACKAASAKTNNPAAKRQFVQAAKDVANNTANLVKNTKVCLFIVQVF